jgi:hypothetical protein
MTLTLTAFRAIIRTYSLFKSERLSVNIRLTLHKALIRSLKIYAEVGVWLPYGAHNQISVFRLTTAGFLMWGTLSDERMGL